MKHTVLIVVLCVLCCLAPKSRAQEVYVKNYRVAQGLPSNNVYHVMQDSKGFLWLGTDMGLARFDGINFKNYSVDNGLPDNEVFEVLEDTKGRFWLGTLNGIISYFDSSGVTTIDEYFDGGGGPSRIIRSLYQLENGSVGIARTGGPVTIVSDTTITHKYHVPAHFVWEHAGSLYGVSAPYLVNLQTGDSLTSLPFKNTNPVRGYHLDHTTVIGVGLDVCILEGITQKHTTALDQKHREVIGIYIHQGVAWLGTRNGVVAVSLSSGQVLATYLDGKQVTGVVCDHEGNYWFSTLYSGVYQWPGSGIKKLVVDPANSSRRINVIEFDAKGNMWLGHDQNGYTIRNPEGLSQQYSFDAKMIDNVTGFKFYRGNTYVISKAKTFVHQNTNIEFNVFINDLDFVKDQVYVAGGEVSRIPIDSLLSLHGRHMQQVVQLSRMGEKTSVIKDRGVTICRGADSQLYVGTIKGLFSVAEGSLPKAILPQVINSSVTEICTLSSSNNLCVATMGNGLLVLHSEGYERIGLGKGVPSNNCQAVYISPQDEIWACFDNQLYLITENQQGWGVKNYSNLLGLVDQRIRSISMKEDLVYLGTDYGLLYFKKNQQRKPRSIPFYLDSVLVNGRTIATSEPILLPAKHNSLETYYTALSYTSSDEISYTYRIDGLDTSDNKTQARNLVFRSLPSGDYSLHIKAATGDGGMAALAPIYFTVSTPLYARVWFWPVLVLLVGGLASVLMLFRFRSLRRRHGLETQRLETEKEKNLIEKQLAELQEKALRMQMNPHFVFNALNTIKGFYAENRGVEANNYIVRFSKLLRVILETQGKEISVQSEIRSLTLYLELLQIRYNYKFDFTFTVAPNVRAEEIEIPSMMLQPFVENAVIHGLAPKPGRGLLGIRFSLKATKLEVLIEDNGVGRAYFKNQSSEGHESAATGITEERLRLFNQLNAASASLSITDLTADGQPTGTIVKLLIDIANEWE